jgi:polar amino acid transport system substrate-binding protein
MIFLAIVLVFAVTTSTYSASIQQDLVRESTVEKVVKRGVLKVGMSTFVPWAMKDKKGFNRL